MNNFNPQEFAEFMEMWQAYKVFQQMKQPQPNPVQAIQSATPAPSQSQIMANSDAAATASSQEVLNLKSEIEKLKLELAAAQEEKRELANELRTSESKRISAETSLKALQESKVKLENITGKSTEEIAEAIKEGKQIVPRSGKGAHDAFAQMIDEGKLDKDTIIYADSEDVLDAIEVVKNSDKNYTVEEIMERATKEEKPQGTLNKNGMVEFIDNEQVNEFGF